MEVDWGISGFLYGNNDTRFGEQEAIAYRLQAKAPSPPGSSKKTGSSSFPTVPAARNSMRGSEL